MAYGRRRSYRRSSYRSGRRGNFGRGRYRSRGTRRYTGRRRKYNNRAPQTVKLVVETMPATAVARPELTGKTVDKKSGRAKL